jgi:hypothetical protein
VIRLLVVLALLSGCHKHEAVGTLLFEVSALGGVDAHTFFATQQEILRSRALQRLIADGGVGDVAAQQRGDALVLAVRVVSTDSQTAVARCNQLMRSYVDHRMQSKIEAASARAQMLAQQLDALTSDADEAKKLKLKEQLREAEEARASRLSDVRLLDACQIQR